MASLCVWEKWLFVAPSARDSSRSLGQTVLTRFGLWISPKKTKTCLAWLNRFWNAGTRHAPRNFQSTGTINERIAKNLLAGCAPAEKSREKAMTAYWNAMNKKVASTTQVTWMKKSGGTVDSSVILVPIFFQGHFFSLHFVTRVQ
jgi:hypothetical protein